MASFRGASMVIRGARAVAERAVTCSRRHAASARPAVLGKGCTVAGTRIVEIRILADPECLSGVGVATGHQGSAGWRNGACLPAPGVTSSRQRCPQPSRNAEPASDQAQATRPDAAPRTTAVHGERAASSGLEHGHSGVFVRHAQRAWWLPFPSQHARVDPVVCRERVDIACGLIAEVADGDVDLRVAGPERVSILRPDGDELPPTSNPPPNLVAVTLPYWDDCQFVHKCRHPRMQSLHDPCPFLLGSIGRGGRRKAGAGLSASGIGGVDEPPVADETTGVVVGRVRDEPSDPYHGPDADDGPDHDPSPPTRRTGRDGRGLDVGTGRDGTTHILMYIDRSAGDLTFT